MAILTGQFGTHRLQLAEDVVQEALVGALQTWPYRGVPDMKLLASRRRDAEAPMKRASWDGSPIVGPRRSAQSCFDEFNTVCSHPSVKAVDCAVHNLGVRRSIHGGGSELRFGRSDRFLHAGRVHESIPEAAHGHAAV